MATRPTLANIIQVGSTWLPGITKYDVTMEDIDAEGSTRSENGTMHREIIRAKVIHAQVTHIVDQTELASICGLIQSNATVNMTVFCPGRGSPNVTADFYVSKVNFDLLRYKDPGTGAVADWWQLNYTLVEV